LLESLQSASSPDTMPAELREAYLKVAPHPEQLPTFFRKSVDRMLQFKDWKPADLQSIQAPSLVLIGDADVIRPEHAVQMFRLLPQAQLAVLPGVDHMTIVKRDDVVLPIITPFLDAPLPEPKKQESH
jgi:pimeloyl-ACP methyl ester carboxylesterase